jgi:hypothetical protein
VQVDTPNAAGFLSCGIGGNDQILMIRVNQVQILSQLHRVLAESSSCRHRGYVFANDFRYVCRVLMKYQGCLAVIALIFEEDEKTVPANPPYLEDEDEESNGECGPSSIIAPWRYSLSKTPCGSKANC